MLNAQLKFLDGWSCPRQMMSMAALLCERTDHLTDLNPPFNIHNLTFNIEHSTLNISLDDVSKRLLHPPEPCHPEPQEESDHDQAD